MTLKDGLINTPQSLRDSSTDNKQDEHSILYLNYDDKIKCSPE